MIKNLISLSSKLYSYNSTNLFLFTTHKLTYGQGGNCQISLHNPHNNYKIQFETIWEDYCNIEFVNNQQKSYVIIREQGNKAILTDQKLYTQNESTNINKQNSKDILIKFQIPEDFTFYGQINGSISHKKSNVSNKLRCNQMKMKLLNKNRIFQWGSMQSPKIDLQVLNGAIDIKSLTFQNGKFRSHSFSSSKVLFSGKFDLQTTYQTNIRSIVTYGNAIAKIVSKYIQIQSISGTFDLQAQKVRIDRLWASPQGIKIKANKIQKIGIQTGTGVIQTIQPINEQMVTLGRLHKGKKTKVSDNKIIIQ